MAESHVNQQAIARHLNVSVATVSKALRNRPDISTATRDRVNQAAREMGYRLGKARPNGQSRSRHGRSVMIGALMHRPLDHSTRNIPTYLDGLCAAAAEHNVTLVVQQYAFNDPLNRIFEPAMQPPAMREGNLAGLLLGGEWPGEVVKQLAQNFSCVSFPYDVAEAEVDTIGMDNIGTIARIVQHLVEDLGHDRIGFFGRCPRFAWASERFAGYVNALSQRQLPYNPDWVIDVGWEPMLNEGHEEIWRRYIDQIDALRRDEGVRAWVCSSDWPGYQLYRGMLDRNVRVPQDVSITGFDDSEPVHLGCPPLTSIRMPRDVMAQAAMKRLLFRMDNPDSPVRHILFPGELMMHGSTGRIGENRQTTERC